MSSPRRARRRPGRLLTLASLWSWAFLSWVILTWTRTTEQLAVGAAVALLAAFALAPLAPAQGPWWCLHPRRALAIARLIVETAARVVRANLELSARIWSPRRPLSSGMIVVPTRERSDGGLAAVGLISSLVVDNQIADLDRRSGHLQFHAVAVPEGGPLAARDQVNGPVERLLAPLEDHRD